MPSHHSRRDSRSRSRSESHSRRHRDRSRSRSHSRDRSHRSHQRDRKRSPDRKRIVRDEFGRNIDVAEYKSQKHDNSSRHHKLSKSPQREEARRERQPSFSPPPVPDTATQISPRDNEAYDPTSGFVDDEVEEGEDTTANMMAMMGFASFGTTKGKHVADNDSIVNQGAARIIKQYKPIRILNRRAKV